jgi:predicted RNA-binding Zn-ribbon protein involved in translation (DUF1610 family)
MGCHRPIGCPLCGSLQIEKSEEIRERAGKTHTWYTCKKCGTKYPAQEFD